jgi:hypothetical protein
MTLTTTEDPTETAPTAGFSVVHAPIPEIKVALLGPLIAGAAGPFRMILVTADALGISCVRVFLSPDETDVAFWHRVLRHHRSTLMQPLAVVPQLSTDTLEGIESLQNWRATPLMKDDLAAGLAEVLAALQSDFSNLLLRQKDLSFVLSSRLLRSADARGPSALKYAFQAIATEPIGLVHFAVSGLPKSDRILETIFLGESLPSALKSIGIKKSVLRRARKSHGGVFAAATSTDVQPVRRAWAWVEKMQRISRRIPEALLDAPDFPEIFESFESLGIEEDGDIDLAVLHYCLKPGRGLESFQRLAEVATNFEAQSNRVPGGGLSINEAFSLALCADTTVLKKLLDTVEMTDLLDSVLAHHPLECGQPDAALPCLTTALASAGSVLAHGGECENCLAVLEAIFDNVCSGVIIYGVRDAAGTVLGTAAFQLHENGCCQQAVIAEVSGRANAAPPREVRAAAKLLEFALNTPPARRKFQNYLKNRDRLILLATKRCAERLVALKH